MVHAFRIKNGQIWYANKYNQTNVYKESKEAGKKVRPYLGEIYGMGVLRVLLY